MNTQLEQGRVYFFFRCWKGLLQLFLSNFFGVCGCFSFLFFFPLNCFCSSLSCNVNTEKQYFKISIMLSSELMTARARMKKINKKRPFRMFLFLLSYIGSFIDRCLSVFYYLYLQAGYYCECKELCSSTFNSISPPTSPQAFEQQRSGTLKSGVESV